MGQGDSKPIIETLSRHVGEQAWREVTLLTIGYLGIRQQLPKIAGEVVDELVDTQPGPAGEAVVLAGDAVLDTWPNGVPLKSRDHAIDALVITMQDATIRPELRRHAGLLLGRLGWRPGDLDRFVEVPAGEYQAGVKKEAKTIPHMYFVARYPVTNIQFARFVKEDGYQNREYWSDLGWEWRSGKFDQHTMESIERDWLEHRPLAKRNMPYYWHNIELSNPIVPVVGVCWFEAEAYCKWLSKKIVAVPEGYSVRLLTSDEWERAARGTDGREYPWGDGFIKSAANTWDSDATGSGLGGTTAVVTFAQGVSLADTWDMSGNVWEWTGSWYDEDKKYRIVRGGSWIGYQWFARSSFCNWSIPLMFNDDLGFRVAIAPK
jgi:formylglycine-generating enzyme required for sulfatase activity